MRYSSLFLTTLIQFALTFFVTAQVTQVPYDPSPFFTTGYVTG